MRAPLKGCQKKWNKLFVTIENNRWQNKQEVSANIVARYLLEGIGTLSSVNIFF